MLDEDTDPTIDVVFSDKPEVVATMRQVHELLNKRRPWRRHSFVIDYVEGSERVNGWTNGLFTISRRVQQMDFNDMREFVAATERAHGDTPENAAEVLAALDAIEGADPGPWCAETVFWDCIHIRTKQLLGSMATQLQAELFCNTIADIVDWGSLDLEAIAPDLQQKVAGAREAIKHGHVMAIPHESKRH